MSSHGCSPGQESYKVEELMKKMKVLRKQQNSPPPQEELRLKMRKWSPFLDVKCSKSADPKPNCYILTV